MLEKKPVDPENLWVEKYNLFPGIEVDLLQRKKEAAWYFSEGEGQGQAVWTLHHNDEGNDYISRGFHHVNTIGWFGMPDVMEIEGSAPDPEPDLDEDEG